MPIIGKARAELRERVITYKRVFATPEGKLVLFDLMNQFHILNGHGGDVRKEGERNAVLYILKMCHRSVEDLDRMMKGEV